MNVQQWNRCPPGYRRLKAWIGLNHRILHSGYDLQGQYLLSIPVFPHQVAPAHPLADPHQVVWLAVLHCGLAVSQHLLRHHELADACENALYRQELYRQELSRQELSRIPPRASRGQDSTESPPELPRLRANRLGYSGQFLRQNPVHPEPSYRRKVCDDSQISLAVAALQEHAARMVFHRFHRLRSGPQDLLD